MSLVLSAADICERALRAINAFPVTETAADPEVMREAMFWLDLDMAELTGTERVFGFVPSTLSVPITNGTQDYGLETVLGSSWPDDGIQFPVGAWLEDVNGNRAPLTIVSRRTFEDKSLIDRSGTLCQIYIDHVADSPTLSIYPVPATTDSNTWTVKLVVQTFAPDVAPDGVTGDKPSSAVAHGFRQAWQRWMIFQLASDLGSGPVIKLPTSSIAVFDSKAADAKARLLAFENREHDTTPPICEPAWDY